MSIVLILRYYYVFIKLDRLFLYIRFSKIVVNRDKPFQMTDINLVNVTMGLSTCPGKILTFCTQFVWWVPITRSYHDFQFNSVNLCVLHGWQAKVKIEMISISKMHLITKMLKSRKLGNLRRHESIACIFDFAHFCTALCNNR